jgi:hypothetical protein
MESNIASLNEAHMILYSIKPLIVTNKHINFNTLMEKLLHK